MTRNEILKKINTIFIDILDNDELVINEVTTAKDVDDWDSLTNIQLIVAIERYFKIRFSSREIQSWNNVGEMLDTVIQKNY